MLHNPQHFLEFITELHLLLHLQYPFFCPPPLCWEYRRKEHFKIVSFRRYLQFSPSFDVVIFLVPVRIILISHCFNLDIVSGPWKSLKKVKRFRDFSSTWMSPLLSRWNVTQMNDFKTNSIFFFFLKAGFLTIPKTMGKERNTYSQVRRHTLYPFVTLRLLHRFRYNADRNYFMTHCGKDLLINFIRVTLLQWCNWT